MSQKFVVEQYIEGFRSGDRAKVLECLTDDVIWRLHGCQTFTGKRAFSDNIDNDEFREVPLLKISELIQEGDRVVVLGFGAIDGESGGQRAFNFCEVFLFKGELIAEVDTFHIWNES